MRMPKELVTFQDSIMERLFCSVQCRHPGSIVGSGREDEPAGNELGHCVPSSSSSLSRASVSLEVDCNVAAEKISSQTIEISQDPLEQCRSSQSEEFDAPDRRRFGNRQSCLLVERKDQIQRRVST